MYIDIMYCAGGFYELLLVQYIPNIGSLHQHKKKKQYISMLYIKLWMEASIIYILYYRDD